MKTSKIRESFLAYFKKQGHTIVPSDSLVPSGDQSLLFTSAGMVQFKKHFLGQTKLDYTKAASCQKCLRTSDIDRVGDTERHLTFFEMLGNFSFGDYFKTDAIAWGWEFLTREMGLPSKLLYPTVYKDDDEAFELWKKFVPESRIVKLGEESNFWNMGPTGPCGPCSEILFDRGKNVNPGHQCPGPGCDCDRYMEVWNLVFTQFDRGADGKLSPLPQKNIDTGMGLERLSLVNNGVASVFETDSFKLLGQFIRKDVNEKIAPKALRIITDHMRAATFLISDGVLPSNEGRGYILRRLLRRALRQGWINGKKEPFLGKLVIVIATDMKDAYPELLERTGNIQAIIEAEEKNALGTIETGTRTFEDEIRKITGKTPAKGTVGKVQMPAEKVFTIYDTYGLDKEIQKEIVRDWNGELVFSEEEYEAARQKAVETARKGWKGSGEKEVTQYSELKKKTGNVKFKGYEELELDSAKVVAILRRAGDLSIDSDGLAKGEEGEIILNETPFYAESGGQVGDQGEMISKTAKITVLDTLKPVDGLITHMVRVEDGSVKTGQSVKATVNADLRRHTMRHHTATHLLHAALRRILGQQVTQAGSLVNPDKLRFDFTFPRAVSRDELAQIEKDVNKAVLANIKRERDEESLDDARKKGALAFFGEKYGAKVFVVGYGDASTEVCGGTHCPATGDIGSFRIVAESSVGSGVRRIEAVAGEKALIFAQEQAKALSLIAEKLRCSPAEAAEKVEKLLQKQTELEKELAGAKHKSVRSSLDDLVAKVMHSAPKPEAPKPEAKPVAQKIELPKAEAPKPEPPKPTTKINFDFKAGGGSTPTPKPEPVPEPAPEPTPTPADGSLPAAAGGGHSSKVIVEELANMDAETLRVSADHLRDKIGSGVVLLVTTQDDKISFVVTVTPDIVYKGLDAGKIAKAFAIKIGGSGGGKESFAQGGGKSIPNLDEIMNAFTEEISASF